MRKLISIAALSVFSLTGVTAFAQDRNDTSMRTTREAREVTEGYLKSNAVTIQPHVGVMAFKDQLGDNTARGAAGLTIDANVARWFGDYASVYIGPQIGAFYSHLGAPGSNFVGTDPTSSSTGAGANLLLMPANLKLGYNLSDNVRVAAHGGGNVIYRSVASSIFLNNDSVGGDTKWDIFPNVGGDIEFGLGKNVALNLRPDWTLAPNNDIFTGTLGLGIALG